MKAAARLLQLYLASHKGTVTSTLGVIVTAFFGALYAQMQSGHRLNLAAAAGATLTALFGILAGLGKSPATPKQDPPTTGGTPQ